MEPYINILILGMIQEFAAENESRHAISPQPSFCTTPTKQNASQFTS